MNEIIINGKQFKYFLLSLTKWKKLLFYKSHVFKALYDQNIIKIIAMERIHQSMLFVWYKLSK